jgi:predicted RND superfamily exporter protein
MASFGTLAFSSHLGTASIGVLLTLSLFFALLCTLVVLPAILAELEVRNEHVRTHIS